MRLRARLTPVLLSLLTFIIYLDTHSLHPFLADYAAALGALPFMVGLIVAVYSLCADVLEVPFGYLMRKLKRKLFLAAGLLVDSFSMFLYSICLSPIHLLGVRIVHGAGGAVAGPAIMSLTADVPHPLARMGARMGLYGASIALAATAGWLLGGVIAAKLGYDWLFYVVACLLLIGFIGAFLLVEPKRLFEEEEERLSIRDLGRSLAQLLRNRRFALSCFAILAHMMTMGAIVALLPSFFELIGVEEAVRPMYIGMFLATYGVVWLILQIPLGFLSDRVGRTFPIVAGLGLASACMLTLSYCQIFHMLLVIAAVYGAAYAMLFPALCATVVEEAPPRDRALASGLFHIMFTQGVVVGAPLFGYVAEISNPAIGLRVSSLAPLALFIAALLLLRER